MPQHLNSNKDSAIIGMLESENSETYNKGDVNSKGESNYKYTNCCCCSTSKWLITWNIFMLVYNAITSTLYITIILTYSQHHYQILISYGIIQILFRLTMNIMGFKSINHIFSKKKEKIQLNRHNNLLFLFGISSIFFTVIFDTVFLVYFTYIWYDISNGSISRLIYDDMDDEVVVNYEMIKLVWFNIIWISDILIILFCVREYFRYIAIDMSSEYYRYKMNFWILMFLSIVMLLWIISNSIKTMTGLLP